jgi:hypothetical protein
MSVITDTWRQLVRRRLWPVAALLVAALAAVPFLLAKDPEPAPVASPASGGSATGTGVLATEPIVALAAPEDRAERRRVLGARHDIFTPTKKAAKATAKAAKADGATAASAGADAAASTGTSGAGASPSPSAGASPSAGGSAGGSNGGSTGTGTGSTGTETPAATPTPEPAPATPEPTWPANSLTVRFGDAAADSLEKSTLERLSPLPSADEPVVIYLGLADEGTTAVFLLGDGVQPTGDGVCLPEPTSCETLALKAGETEFLDVMGEDGTTPGAQYELDVVAIHPAKTATGATAAAAKAAKTATAGTRAIKAHVAVLGPLPWRYDRATGALKRRAHQP